MSGTRSIADLPGPPGLPLIGNLHQMGGPNEALGTIERWCDLYGPIFKFRMGGRVAVVVCDVEEINRILRERPERYRRVREIETAFAELGFPGVFSVEGETWRGQRHARGRRSTSARSSPRTRSTSWPRSRSATT
jgi:Cytochrome P450